MAHAGPPADPAGPAGAADPAAGATAAADSAPTRPKRKSPGTGHVLVVTSVMFTFISYWRTAAIVLCDLASTAYYIGGIVEQQIGKAAPWFILGVMVFGYFIRMVYIESCSMFVRGGVYRIVKEAMGIGPAKLAVSALLFDYILTGPISSVSAGGYVIGLVTELFGLTLSSGAVEIGSAGMAVLVTLYFWRVNTKGIHESSDKALKIMGATTVMGVVMILWCLVTLAAHPEKAKLPTALPDLSRAGDAGSVKVDLEGKPITDALGQPLDPLGFIGRYPPVADALRPGRIHWLSLLGVLGIFIAFGHSILALSGEETLAQVYREVESPKLPNFKKAAFVVFVYSLLLTSLISFFAVIIPDGLRMSKYSGNLIGGLAMNVVGPLWARLALNALVVGVGFLILSGAVNTAIIGSNGVLNRVAEDGVIPDWFLKPHPRYGTTYRLVNLVVALQLFTIVVSRGRVLVLGEAYAFGVVWSFVFNAMSMLVLRFKRSEPREYEVPINVRVGRYDVPLGIGMIFLVLAISASVNFLTKEVATVTGVFFTATLFGVFTVSAWGRTRSVGAGDHHEHLEQFNQKSAEEITPASLAITKPYRKLVAIRSPHNLAMLEKCLAETDPETTDVVVMTATLIPPASADYQPAITEADRALLTAVVNLAELAGKPVKPLIVPTNEPMYALTKTAYTVGAQEMIMGMSNKFDPSDQLDQVALYWLNMSKGEALPLTVRVLSKDRDVRMDIAGGSQIPRAGEGGMAAKTLAELRSSWRGVGRLILAYDGSSLSTDFLDTVLSFLDPSVTVTLVDVSEHGGPNGPDPEAAGVVRRGVERARELGRDVGSLVVRGEPGAMIVRAAHEGRYDAIFMSLRGEYRALDTVVTAPTVRYVLQHAPCRVILGFAPKSIQPVAPAEPSQPAAR